ncbi:MAG: hypothetical protein ABIG20_00270 [archaeon]
MNNKKTKALIIVGFIVLLIAADAVLAAAREETTPQQKEGGIASQFLGSLKCIFTECGWPAIIIFILPPIAMWVWKKFFSVF